MNWQLLALVEVVGSLRARIALLCSEHQIERAELKQKLEAASDALGRHELNEGIRQRELGRQILEVERLNEELARVLRERDEARARLEAEKAFQPLERKDV